MSKYTSRTLRHEEITDPNTDWFYRNAESEGEPITGCTSVGAILAMAGSMDASIDRRTPVEMLADGVPLICDYEPCGGNVVSGSYVTDGRRYTHNCFKCGKHFPVIKESSESVCESGYRWMKEGDVVRHGDECSQTRDANSIDRGWRQTSPVFPRDPLSKVSAMHYRRPITPDGTDLWQMVDGKLCRKMVEGEVTQAGDFFDNGKFYIVFYYPIILTNKHRAHYRPAPIQPVKAPESEVGHKVTTEPEKRDTEQPKRLELPSALSMALWRKNLQDEIDELIADREQWKALSERQAKTIQNMRDVMDGENE